jgi:hypothetical protein
VVERLNWSQRYALIANIQDTQIHAEIIDEMHQDEKT